MQWKALIMFDLDCVKIKVLQMQWKSLIMFEFKLLFI